MTNAIEIQGLTKSFSGFTLDRLSLTLPSGCILGLIGENGAGKSTTIKLLLGMIKPDAGSAKVLGVDISQDMKALREDIGVVLDEPGLPHNLSARMVNKIMRHIYKNWSSEEFFSLLRHENEAGPYYSTGPSSPASAAGRGHQRP